MPTEPKMLPSELLRSLEYLAKQEDLKAEVWEDDDDVPEALGCSAVAAVLREAAAVVKAHYFDGSISSGEVGGE